MNQSQTPTQPPPLKPAWWITGAGSGIGKALVDAWAGGQFDPLTGPDRPTLFISGRRPEPLHALAERYQGVTPSPLDVTDRDAVAATVDAMPPIETAILCAGTHRPTPAHGLNAGHVRALMETNLMGIAHCLENLLPRMLSQGRGRLVLVASVAGYRGLPTAAGYSASKAAVIALAESLKLDLDGTGVQVQVVAPGFVDTPLTQKNPFPMPDIISAEQAAAHIIKGMERQTFRIAFPRRFACAMRVLRHMPDSWYFRLMHKFTGL